MSEISLNGVHHISCITGDAPGQRRVLCRPARHENGQEDRQPGRPVRLPPVLRRREGQPRIRPDLLRVPRRASGPGRRRAWSTGSCGGSPRPNRSPTGRSAWPPPARPPRWSSADPRLGGTGIDTGERSLCASADPEGLEHEFLVYEGDESRWCPLHSEVPPEHAIAGFHGVNAYSGAPEGTEAVLVAGARLRGPRATVPGGSPRDDRSGFYLLDPAPEGAPDPRCRHRPPHRLGDPARGPGPVAARTSPVRASMPRR